MAKFKRGQTAAVRAGVDQDSAYGAVMPPIYLTSNYVFEDIEKPGIYDYARTSNPNRDHLQGLIATLEGGAGSVVTGSGMAAINLVLDCLPIGAHVVAPKDCYGGTFRLLQWRERQGRLAVTYVDQCDSGEVLEAVSEGVDLIWVETPTNPLLRLVDIKKLADIAHEHGGQIAVDNTFLSPALQRPLTLDADLVVHSTTKYLNGHGDVVGGVVVSANIDQHRELAAWANALGLTGGVFDAHMTLRGLRTLYPRMRTHEYNARALAERLAGQDGVAQVYYPGLADHPQHELAKQQQVGFGAMISFELTAGRDAVKPFVNALELFSLAESLGGVESLICHPATMTHLPLGEEGRAAAGISDALLRLSVGIEHVDDLAADLERGFEAIK